MAKKRKSENELVASAGAAPAPARRRTDAAASHKTRTPANSVAEPLVASVVTALVHGPTSDQIAALAYSYWADRGYQQGSPEEDWLRAESELRLAAQA